MINLSKKYVYGNASNGMNYGRSVVDQRQNLSNGGHASLHDKNHIFILSFYLLILFVKFSKLCS